jgi:TolB-like protein
VSIRSLAIVPFAVSMLVAASAQGGVRIALLPISVHAAGEDTGYLSTGLVEMIAARLDQYDGIAVVRPAGQDGSPEGAGAAREAARKAGAEFAVFGSFTQFGDGASLDLRCARVGAEDAETHDPARRIFIQSGTVAEIIPLLDTLAKKIARYAIGAGEAAPRVAGEESAGDEAPDRAAGADYEGLLRRVEALERALYPPVAAGESVAPEAAEPDGEGVVLR